MADSLSVAVISNPGLFIPENGNVSYLEKALWKLPSEFAARSPDAKLDAIMVIGNLVGTLLSKEEETELADARKKLDAEYARDKEGYLGQDVLDLTALVEELMHSSKAMAFNKEIETYGRLIGRKLKRNWQKMGVAHDRAKVRYGQMLIAAKKCEQKYDIPVFFAADTFMLENEIPEPHWLHWRDFTLADKRVKVWGNHEVKGIIPEYAIPRRQRGKALVDIAKFAADSAYLTVASKMEPELSARLTNAKGNIVVIGQQTEHDVPFLNNMVIRQPKGRVDFLTLDGKNGTRTQYRWDADEAKKKKLQFVRASEIAIEDLALAFPEQVRATEEMKKDVVAYRELREMAQAMARFAHLADKGVDTPAKILEHLKKLEDQVEPLRQYTANVAEFVERLAKDSGMADWYVDVKNDLAKQVTAGIFTEQQAGEQALTNVITALQTDFKQRRDMDAKRAEREAGIREQLEKDNKDLQKRVEDMTVQLTEFKGAIERMEGESKLYLQQMTDKDSVQSRLNITITSLEERLETENIAYMEGMKQKDAENAEKLRMQQIEYERQLLAKDRNHEEQKQARDAEIDKTLKELGAEHEDALDVERRRAERAEFSADQQFNEFTSKLLRKNEELRDVKERYVEELKAATDAYTRDKQTYETQLLQYSENPAALTEAKQQISDLERKLEKRKEDFAHEKADIERQRDTALLREKEIEHLMQDKFDKQDANYKTIVAQQQRELDHSHARIVEMERTLRLARDRREGEKNEALAQQQAQYETQLADLKLKFHKLAESHTALAQQAPNGHDMGDISWKLVQGVNYLYSGKIDEARRIIAEAVQGMPNNKEILRYLPKNVTTKK